MPDSIPPVVKQILDLFAEDGALAQVKFGDLDRTVLDQAAARVEAHADAVARAEAALESARAQLAESQESLLGRAQRALAYARVFAEDDAELFARLEVLALPRTPTRRLAVESSAPHEVAPARRRARAREAAAASPPLFEKQDAEPHVVTNGAAVHAPALSAHLS